MRPVTRSLVTVGVALHPLHNFSDCQWSFQASLDVFCGSAEPLTQQDSLCFFNDIVNDFGLYFCKSRLGIACRHSPFYVLFCFFVIYCMLCHSLLYHFSLFMSRCWILKEVCLNVSKPFSQIASVHTAIAIHTFYGEIPTVFSEGVALTLKCVMRLNAGKTTIMFFILYFLGLIFIEKWGKTG